MHPLLTGVLGRAPPTVRKVPPAGRLVTVINRHLLAARAIEAVARDDFPAVGALAIVDFVPFWAE